MKLLAAKELAPISGMADRFERDYLMRTSSRGGAKQAATAGPGQGGDVWAQMVELGWTAMGVPESSGGLAMGTQERMVLAETFGRSLITEPYWSTAVLGCDLLIPGGAASADLLERIAVGQTRLAVLGADGFGIDAPEGLQLVAKRAPDGYRLHGRCPAALDAAIADHWLVLARTDEDGPRSAGAGGSWSLFLVEPGSAGVAVRNWATVDGRSCSDVRMEAVRPIRHLVEQDARPAIEGAVSVATLWLCGEAIGAMDALLTRTIAYLKERVQFGKPLASFQVLRHRVVDMYVTLEQGRSLVWSALQALDDEPARRDAAISAAKWQIGKGGRWLGESAVQLHGGIGMTEELPVGRYLRRLVALDAMLGNADRHLRRCARLESDGAINGTRD